MSENKTTPKDYYDKEMIEYIDNAVGIGRAIKDIDKTLELWRNTEFDKLKEIVRYHRRNIGLLHTVINILTIYEKEKKSRKWKNLSFKQKKELYKEYYDGFCIISDICNTINIIPLHTADNIKWVRNTKLKEV